MAASMSACVESLKRSRAALGRALPLMLRASTSAAAHAGSPRLAHVTAPSHALHPCSAAASTHAAAGGANDDREPGGRFTLRNAGWMFSLMSKYPAMKFETAEDRRLPSEAELVDFFRSIDRPFVVYLPTTLRAMTATGSVSEHVASHALWAVHRAAMKFNIRNRRLLDASRSLASHVLMHSSVTNEIVIAKYARVLGTYGKLEDALGTLASVTSRGMWPTVFFFNDLMKSALEAGYPSEALRIYGMLGDFDHSPHISSRKILLYALRQAMRKRDDAPGAAAIHEYLRLIVDSNVKETPDAQAEVLMLGLQVLMMHAHHDARGDAFSALWARDIAFSRLRAVLPPAAVHSVMKQGADSFTRVSEAFVAASLAARRVASRSDDGSGVGDTTPWSVLMRAIPASMSTVKESIDTASSEKPRARAENDLQPVRGGGQRDLLDAARAAFTHGGVDDLVNSRAEMLLKALLRRLTHGGDEEAPPTKPLPPPSPAERGLLLDRAEILLTLMKDMVVTPSVPVLTTYTQAAITAGLPHKLQVLTGLLDSIPAGAVSTTFGRILRDMNAPQHAGTILRCLPYLASLGIRPPADVINATTVHATDDWIRTQTLVDNKCPTCGDAAPGPGTAVAAAPVPPIVSLAPPPPPPPTLAQAAAAVQATRPSSRGRNSVPNRQAAVAIAGVGGAAMRNRLPSPIRTITTCISGVSVAVDMTPPATAASALSASADALALAAAPAHAALRAVEAPTASNASAAGSTTTMATTSVNTRLMALHAAASPSAIVAIWKVRQLLQQLPSLAAHASSHAVNVPREVLRHTSLASFVHHAARLMHTSARAQEVIIRTRSGALLKDGTAVPAAVRPSHAPPPAVPAEVRRPRSPAAEFTRRREAMLRVLAAERRSRAVVNTHSDASRPRCAGAARAIAGRFDSDDAAVFPSQQLRILRQLGMASQLTDAALLRMLLAAARLPCSQECWEIWRYMRTEGHESTALHPTVLRHVMRACAAGGMHAAAWEVYALAHPRKRGSLPSLHDMLHSTNDVSQTCATVSLDTHVHNVLTEVTRDAAVAVAASSPPPVLSGSAASAPPAFDDGTAIIVTGAEAVTTQPLLVESAENEASPSPREASVASAALLSPVQPGVVEPSSSAPAATPESTPALAASDGYGRTLHTFFVEPVVAVQLDAPADVSPALQAAVSKHLYIRALRELNSADRFNESLCLLRMAPEDVIFSQDDDRVGVACVRGMSPMPKRPTHHDVTHAKRVEEAQHMLLQRGGRFRIMLDGEVVTGRLLPVDNAHTQVAAAHLAAARAMIVPVMSAEDVRAREQRLAEAAAAAEAAKHLKEVRRRAQLLNSERKRARRAAVQARVLGGSTVVAAAALSTQQQM